ncbi:DotA/TraY family protein [Porticoccaceae bacterium]|nr:DotA/TraY family protein [Porticoccaceae bacterium]
MLKNLPYKILIIATGLLATSSSGVFAQDEESTQRDPDSVINDMLSRGDNILMGVVDQIFGGGTFLNQETNLLGTLSGHVAPMLGLMILVTMTYKGFMWLFRTGMAGEAGGEQGPTRVSLFYSAILPALAFPLVMGVGVSGYAPIQYIAHSAIRTGVELGDGVAIIGSKFFTSSNSQSSSPYLGSGGAATEIDSTETDLLFSAVAVANACRIAVNKDLEGQNKQVVLREKSIENQYWGDSHIFSYELETLGLQEGQPLNGFCGQIKLSKSGPSDASRGAYGRGFVMSIFDGDYDNSGMHTEKFQRDIIAIRKFINNFHDVSKPYQENYLPKTLGNDIQSLVSQIDILEGELTTAIENSAPQDQLNKIESSINGKMSALDLARNIESTRNSFLRGQTSKYTAVNNQLITDITSTASDLVGRYETISSENITFEEELEKRGLIVLGTQFWGVTQLSARVRELARLNIDLIDATLSSNDGDYTRSIDQQLVVQTLEHQYTSARPWNKNEILTAKGAGYKARRFETTNEEGDTIVSFENDQARGSINKLAERLADSLKAIIGSSDNIIITTQQVGEWVGGIGWAIYLLTTVNPLSSDEDDSWFSRAAKVLATTALSASSATATGGASLAALPLKLLAIAAAAFGEFIKMISVPMMFVGAFMSYYIPSMPAIYFYMAVFGILIIFIESLIALPWWTAMIPWTSGEEGWETPHMRQGVILLLGLVFRLVGNVMIFFVVIILLETAGPLFVSLLADVVLSIFSTSTAGPLGWLFMVGIIAMFAYQLIIRSFSLITDLMDMIMRGMNVGHQTFGSQSDEERGRAMLVGLMPVSPKKKQENSPQSQS